MKNNSKAFKHFFKAFQYSLSGFKWAVYKESAFRQDIIFSILVISLVAFISDFDPLKMFTIIAVCIVLLITELLNSAIESVVDIVSPDFNILAKAAKDMGSAAVFLSIVLVLIVLFFSIFIF